MSHPDPHGQPDLTPITIGEDFEDPVTRERCAIVECPWDNPEGRSRPSVIKRGRVMRVHRLDRTRSNRLSKTVDIIAGLSLILKSISKLTHPESFWPLIAVAFGGGILILLGTVFHSRLHKRFRHLEATVSLVEGLTCALVGVASVERGAHFIQYAWFVAAFAFIGGAVIRVRKSLASVTPVAAARG